MDKTCKYCAMTIPEKASICPHCRKRIRTSTGVKVFLGVIMAIVVFAMIRSSGTQQGTATPQEVTIGQNGRLSGTGELMPVGVTNEALDEFISVRRAGNNEAVTQMIVIGRIFTVKNQTKVTVLAHGDMFVRKIRVLEGAMRGRTGYVASEWIKPL